MGGQATVRRLGRRSIPRLSYAKTFDLDQSIRLKTPVRHIERNDGRWRIVIGDGRGDTSPVLTAEELRELRMLVGALGDRAPELGTALHILERLAAQQR